MVTVQIDLYGNGEFSDIWQASVYDLSKEGIIELYEDYEKQYESDEFDGAWEDFLNYKKVKFSNLKFDLKL